MVAKSRNSRLRQQTTITTLEFWRNRIPFKLDTLCNFQSPLAVNLSFTGLEPDAVHFITYATKQRQSRFVLH